MKFNVQRWLPRPTTIGLALIVVLLLCNMLISEWSIDRLVENEHRVIQTEEVLTVLETVLANITEAETAERGFLITENSEYLDTYRSAVDQTGRTLDRLTRLTVDDAVQQAQIPPLRERVRLRLDELERAIAIQQSAGFGAARHSVSTNHGRQLMNEMRALVGQMQQHEQQSLKQRDAESQASAYATHATDMLGSMLGIGMVGLALFLFRRDLSHRQRADEVSRRLAAIVESSDDAILGKSLDGTIVSWNAAARRLYGYSQEEAVGKAVTVLCPPERQHEVLTNLTSVRQGVHIEHFETVRVRKDRRRIDVSLSISPVKDANGTVVGASAIARDITDRLVLQREILDIAAEEQRRIGQDLHDGTGQELTGLAMMAEHLAGELGTKSLPEANLASKIVDGLEQALSHVRAISKGLVPVEVDAEGLMIALAELASRTSDIHGVHCCFRCDEPVCILDNQTAMHLYRLSQEAVTNAVKHSRGRNIVIGLETTGDFVTLRISDDGLGLSPARNQSVGSGLRIMRYRAELMGASLTVESPSPGGTMVTCILPWRGGPLSAVPSTAPNVD